MRVSGNNANASGFAKKESEDRHHALSNELKSRKKLKKQLPEHTHEPGRDREARDTPVMAKSYLTAPTESSPIKLTDA